MGPSWCGNDSVAANALGDILGMLSKQSRYPGCPRTWAGSEALVQKFLQAFTALPIGPPEALMTSSLMSVN